MKKMSIFTIYIIFLVAAGCQQNVPPIIVGDLVEVTTDTIDSGGGTITVDKPGDPLDGLTIEVPDGAYAGSTTFKISYKPIEKHNLPSGYEPISPYIIVENGGEYSDGIMSFTVPADIPDGYLGMVFYYDESTGEMEPAAPIGQSATSLTIATRHFSGSFATRKPISELQGLKLDTKFTPGEDTWQFKNEGAAGSPKGICRGMTVSSMYYYVVRKMDRGEGKLSGRYDGYSLGNDKITPDFTLDDDVARKLCTVYQNEVKPYTADRLALVHDYEGGFGGDTLQFYATAAAFKIWDPPRPVYISVYSNERKVGHALVCYRIDNYTLYVADPNDPTNKERKIEYDPITDQFNPYFSAQNSLEALLGLYGYDKIALDGLTALHNPTEINELWSSMESGIVDNAEKYFDDYVLWAKEKNDAGETTDEYALDTHNVFYSGEKTLEVTLNEAFDGKLTEVYKATDSGENKDGKSIFDVTPLSSNQIELEEGENMLGFHVEAFKTWENSKKKEESGYRWNGFDWVNVVYEEEEDSTTTTTMPASYYYIGTIKFTAEYTASWGATLNCVAEGAGHLTLGDYSPNEDGIYVARFRYDTETSASFDEEDDTRNTCEVRQIKDFEVPCEMSGTHDRAKGEFTLTYKFKYHGITEPDPPCASDTLHGTYNDKTAEFKGTVDCDIPYGDYYATIEISFTGSQTDDPPFETSR